MTDSRTIAADAANRAARSIRQGEMEAAYAWGLVAQTHATLVQAEAIQAQAAASQKFVAVYQSSENAGEAEEKP